MVYAVVTTKTRANVCSINYFLGLNGPNDIMKLLICIMKQSINNQM